MKHFYKFPLFILFICTLSLMAQQTYVPDDNFETALINMGYDDVLDDYVLTANISALTSLSLDNQSISDMTGIEDFGLLEFLYLQDNLLTEIDLAKNVQLKELWLNFNQLKSLDLSANVRLVNAVVHANKLTNLITDGAVRLEYLECSENELMTIDVSNNINLMGLVIDMNPMKTIDLVNIVKLHTLSLIGGKITRLDCSANKNLENLYCYDGMLNELIVKGAEKLDALDCSGNSLTTLDLSENLQLKELSCHSNQINSLDLSGLPILTHAWIDNNQFIELKTDGAIALEQIDCSNNKIEDLDFSTNVSLNYFNCRDNALKSLNIKNGNNENIFEMDTRNNPALGCIQVDNAVYSTSNWNNIDATSSFSEDCFYALGVGDEELNSELLLYPNPSVNHLIFECKVPLLSLEVYSYLGQCLMEVKDPESEIDISVLNPGLYVIRIISENGVTTRRILKN